MISMACYHNHIILRSGKQISVVGHENSILITAAIIFFFQRKSSWKLTRLRRSNYLIRVGLFMSKSCFYVFDKRCSANANILRMFSFRGSHIS